MGREIRRVTPDWEHPKTKEGGYQPVFDEPFEIAASNWIANCFAWEKGEHLDLINNPELKEKYPYYWQYCSNPPDEEFYRPEFKSEPTAYQIYENVTEGTPISPVFETEEEMFNWLIKEGHSETAARNFIKQGFCFSFRFHRDENGLKMEENIHSCE